MLIVSGLWLFDEILTEALYCVRPCRYPFPGGFSLALYDAESVGWVIVLLGVILLLLESLIFSKREEVSD
jgi:hypothetical protein